ncbi:MAG: hypothetical protein ACI4DK_03845 [Lachnospiraceae bacterium]
MNYNIPEHKIKERLSLKIIKYISYMSDFMDSLNIIILLPSQLYKAIYVCYDVETKDSDHD